ncbi:MAG: methyltransferase domain-containing protein [Deltaproteobacteria bacterium]|nr:methyltransferase domain-containing protein [Deltaproteobacteria bacterium]
MRPDKDTIQRSFARAADTYDRSSALQKEVASDLARCVETLVGSPDFGHPAFERAGLDRMLTEVRLSARTEKVLDVGCGTGNLVAELKKVCRRARVYASDIALPMLLKARENRAEATLVASDCESLPFASSSFDMVTSSLTYQWAASLTAAFREAERVLRPGGLFVFSTLGPSTLNELRASYKEARASSKASSLMEFKKMDEVSEELSGAGLELISLESLPVFKRYADLRELLRTLKNIGASPPLDRNRGLSVGSVLKEAGRVYAGKFPAPGGDGIIATYEVIFTAARCKRTPG